MERRISFFSFFLVACSGVEKYSVRITEANLRIREFPSEIPGARLVQKYEFKGATCSLVHIGQIHWAKGLNEDELKGVEQVQDNIYLIISFLIENHSLRYVYNEGVSEEIIAIEELEEVTKTRKDKGKIEPAGEQKTRFDAVKRLKKEGRLDIRPAERLDVFLATGRLTEGYQKGEIPFDMLFTIHEIREDNLLEFIVSDGNVFAVTVFGGAHKWLNNIMRWNRDNPDRKLSLIEVTPEDYPDFSVDKDTQDKRKEEGNGKEGSKPNIRGY